MICFISYKVWRKKITKMLVVAGKVLPNYRLRKNIESYVGETKTDSITKNQLLHKCVWQKTNHQMSMVTDI